MKKILINTSIKILEWINLSASDGLQGFYASVKVSIIVTPFIVIWDKISNWGLSNQDYILIVLGAIFVDWIFGSIKHIFFTNTFSIKKNAIGLTAKIALATAGGFLFEGLNYIVRDAELVLVVMKTMTRVIIFLYPGISAFENIYIVSDEKFPPKAWMERLKKWNNSLNPKDLIDDEK